MADATFNAGIGAPFSGTVNIKSGVNQLLLNEQSAIEVTLKESLTSPQLYTCISIQDLIHTDPVKIYSQYKGTPIQIIAANPNLPDNILDVTQTIYRIEARKGITYQTEGYTIYACDNSVLINATTRISKRYANKTPTQIVQDALSKVFAPSVDIEQTGPQKDYDANKIRPFQVVQEQADQSLSSVGNDPSLMHYMTFANGGTHHFRSLKTLATQESCMYYTYLAKGQNRQIQVPSNIMTYNFPCDFDLLSDLQNGVTPSNPGNISPIATNPHTSAFNLLQSAVGNIAAGVGLLNLFHSNKGSTDNRPETAYDLYALHDARMSLIQQDKIVINMVVPFNPILNAGKIIEVEIYPQMEHTDKLIPDFGSGKYMIVNLTHNIKTGGYSTSIIDAVAHTVGSGLVGF